MREGRESDRLEKKKEKRQALSFMNELHGLLLQNNNLYLLEYIYIYIYIFKKKKLLRYRINLYNFSLKTNKSLLLINVFDI
jgi:hypothetical protein